MTQHKLFALEDCYLTNKKPQVTQVFEKLCAPLSVHFKYFENSS